MTEINILKLINSVNKGEISKKMFGQIVNYFNENSEKSAQIERWQKEAEIRKKVLLAIGFETYSQNFFTKIIYNIDEYKKHDMRQEIMFDSFDSFGMVDTKISISIRDHLRARWIDQKIGIIDIIQNPDKYPDLIRYIKLRNDFPVMKKLIE